MPTASRVLGMSTANIAMLTAFYVDNGNCGRLPRNSAGPADCPRPVSGDTGLTRAAYRASAHGLA
jgi:hypothetical protein